MNTRYARTLVTVAIAVAGAAAITGAYAAEATQYNPEAGSATRAQVQRELRGARAASGAIQLGDATVFVDQASTLTRAQARQDSGAGTTRVVRLGEATQFIDQTGVLTRADVRAETLAAIRASRAH